ncbi:MAG: hypothetical protein GXP39_00835 [Chloroflexi bacterium]|nr:hypothetical protein [Chloroflexota bacterium]
MEHREQRTYQRFTATQRIEHFVLMLSFTALAITGLPQKYVGHNWAETMIGWMGGIETVRQIHHAAAVVLLLGSIFHVVAIGYRLFVLRVPPAILPHPRDLLDMIDEFRYLLGLAKKPPPMDRYTYHEKLEYWGVVWGTLIMAITGFMMWNPITTTRFLPGEVIPAAKAAHGGEAILAVLTILTWHTYHAHIKHFNKSIFTGKLTEEEMEEEHPLELERIKAGQVPTPPDEETRRRREHLYIPVAGIMSAVLLFGLYEFVTFEETAITTLPRRVTVVAYAPATPTPTATPTATATPTPMPKPTFTPTSFPVLPGVPIPHVLTQRENCVLCHGQGAMKPFPTDHAGRGNETCLKCHPLTGNERVLPTTQPASVPSFQTAVLPILQAKCVVCHGGIAGLHMTTYEGLMQGSEHGPVIVPGQPDKSLLVQKMLSEHPTLLTEEELAIVRAWIEAGAPNN